MTPEGLYQEAIRALNQSRWEEATSYAMTGLLSMAIGAARSMATTPVDIDLTPGGDI